MFEKGTRQFKAEMAFSTKGQQDIHTENNAIVPIPHTKLKI